MNIRSLSNKEKARHYGKMALFIGAFPIVYLLALGENGGFTHIQDFKIFNREFFNEFKHALLFSIGFTTKDDSKKLARYENKCLAKKYKLDYDVYSAFKRKYGLNAYFKKGECKYYYDSSIGFSDSHATIKQIDKDKFIYNFNTGSYDLSDKKSSLNSQYQMTKEQVLSLLQKS